MKYLVAPFLALTISATAFAAPAGGHKAAPHHAAPTLMVHHAAQLPVPQAHHEAPKH